MSIKKMKGAKGKCDTLFSKIIRFKGSCERCGSTQYLQTSHIISRRFSATRTCTDNAQCLCARCHHFFTIHPVEFGRWIFNSVGEETYNQLKAKSETVTKVDWDQELLKLQIIYTNLQNNKADDWIID